MKTVFADTFYWIALADPKDEWHGATKNVAKSHYPLHTVTTDEVLVEFVTHFCQGGPLLRDKAVKLVRRIRDDPNITVVPQSRESFDAGLDLYTTRADKKYSLTDCISMQTMKSRNVLNVLTHDHHFQQEGFTILLTDKNA